MRTDPAMRAPARKSACALRMTLEMLRIDLLKAAQLAVPARSYMFTGSGGYVYGLGVPPGTGSVVRNRPVAGLYIRAPI